MNEPVDASAGQPQQRQADRVDRYVDYLLDLAQRDDRGAMAALRRSLQEPSGISMSACPYVIPFLGGSTNPWLERVFYLVGALFALHPEHRKGMSLGAVFREVNQATAEGSRGADNPSIRARFVALLDAHQDDIGDHLRHAVALARAHGISLDWTRLCRDLRNWDAEDRKVQRRLARDFWERSSAAEATDDASTKSEGSP